ncbi:hypothetical protein ZHAS_00012364 [Anopheles sinensis]|uniref:Uncharacterized protein n=1 Tax=Anopheles sinensis TaxID=74873 RepID=A0A084W2N6_ANOSI|nr:hypothetical protein ZHAS_00012364 [Anopheles sinensis]
MDTRQQHPAKSSCKFRWDPQIVIKLTTILIINGWQVQRYINSLNASGKIAFMFLLAGASLSIFLAVLRIVANIAVQIKRFRSRPLRNKPLGRVLTMLRKIDAQFWPALGLLTINLALQVFGTMPLLCEMY